MVAIVQKKKNEELWEKLLSQSISFPHEISKIFNMEDSLIEKVISNYPLFINPYYLSLIKEQGDCIYKQAIPDISEIDLDEGHIDPLNEEELSPVPGLTHKYPDRVLFLISSRCAMFCRFCNRKRKVGKHQIATKETIKEGIAYIKANKNVRDVLLSGGDPLLLSDHELFNILNDLRSIPHVEIIRIGTRVPCTLPQRITTQLTKMFKGFHPLYINTHFNHPNEITADAFAACSLLADAGIPLGCQTVLLKGVNDDIYTMKELMRKLLAMRVKPYYLFQADLVKGTSHFWTPLSKGIEIMSGLQGYMSGLGVPRFMIDLPNGGGKIPVIPEYIQGIEGNEYIIQNYKGEEYRYPTFSMEHGA